jgi:U3 small nucleolar RNA-associated protein 22
MTNNEHLKSFRISFTEIRGNKFKTALILEDAENNFRIRILPSIPQGALKAFRLGPSKCSVRGAYFQQFCPQKLTYDDQPTPNVNASILSEMFHNQHTKIMHDIFQEYPNLPAGIQCIKVWFTQRNCFGIGSLSGFQISMLVLYALQQGIFDISMNDIQILKVFLHFLAGLDLSKPLSLALKEPEIPQECSGEFATSNFKKFYEVVLIDPFGYLNILFDVSRNFFEIIKQDANNSYKMLMEYPQSAKSLIIIPDNEHLKGDNFLSFTIKSESVDVDELDGISKKLLKIVETMKKALTDRLSNLLVRVEEIESSVFKISCALFLNKEQCFRLVDIGPSASDKIACQAFREFWGEKADLRQFKDSSIKEAAVWEEYSKERHIIVVKICQFILKRHFGLDSVNVAVSQLDFAFPKGSFGAVIESFDAVSKALRNLPSLPLSIVSCEAMAPACRYTELMIPVNLNEVDTKSNKLGHFVPAHQIVLRVEGSGKWPEDPHAAQLLKEAFYLQISRLLVEEHHLECSFGKEYLDIQCNGYVFRCYLTYTGEIQMIARNGLDVKRAEELFALKPLHAKAIHGLSTRNVVYGPTVRLAKRFVSSQMLSNLISEELIELLVAFIFLHPGRYSEPCSNWTGFLRFLNLIATFDWEVSPVIVNFQEGWSRKQYEVETEMLSHQEHYSVLLTTSYDSDFKKPSFASLGLEYADVWNEFKRLATAAFKYITTNPDADLKPIFKRSAKAFDGVIQLDSSVINRAHESLSNSSCTSLEDTRTISQNTSIKLKNASLEVDFLRYLPGFDPVSLLLSDLNRNFGKMAIFYYDVHGGSFIGYRLKSDVGDDQKQSIHNKCLALCKDMAISSTA